MAVEVVRLRQGPPLSAAIRLSTVIRRQGADSFEMYSSGRGSSKARVRMTRQLQKNALLVSSVDIPM